MKKYNEMSQHDKESLTALYKAYDYMVCNDIPADDVTSAIQKIESQYEE